MSQARGGRLPAAVDAAMEALNSSVDIDKELWRQDIAGSIAHARGLARAGVLTEPEAETIVGGLEAIAREIESGQFRWDPAREDVHMNVEARLIEKVGPVGGKLHTGRSRNDQVATDLRLWTRAKVDEALGAVRDLALAIVDRADSELDSLMPAYTHLQPAQPSRLSHHLMAWQELLWRDRGRLADARARLDECPLGAGAVAGSGFALDRRGVAEALGFARPMRNSLDATASRDFLMEVASALAITAVHLSRVGEEIVLWSTREFGYVTLSDQFSTSSSMMPQKKNPDVAELVRGRAARAVGSVTSLLVLEKSLGFGYGRDLQEDKRPIFDAFDCVLVSTRALTGAIATATFHRDRMRAALEHGHLCATDLADAIARRGVAFREAHHVVGALVREAETRSVELAELPVEVILTQAPALTDRDLAEIFDPVRAVERRSVVGGPARERVAAEIRDARVRWEQAPVGSPN